ncbi:hypothetical protein [Pectinatus brassicae]|uniref:Uncharacterized protein n=1 Tax=Pectinatus brassicae TaxID=862415 RepID=A0A840UGB3_9FIRM|nr:hypothetical protein [Pectinatus brassicae]MBB5336156.1 hypothetical protein [Pectinatus brassicae]
MLMVFLGAALIVVVISVFFIYKIVTFFKVEIKLKAIVLSALLAFTLCFMIWPLAGYQTIYYNYLIIGIVLIGTTISVLYNRRLLTKPNKHQLSSIEDVVLVNDVECVDTSQKTIAENLFYKTKLEKKKQEQTAIKAKTAENNVLAASKQVAVINDLAEAGEGKSRYQLEKLQTLKNSDNNYQMTKNCLTEQQKDKILSYYGSNKKNLVSKINDIACSKNAEISLSSLNLLKIEKEKIVAFVAKAESIDEIINCVYEQNSKKNFGRSLWLLQNALAKHYNSEYAPFICIEVSNIYKKFGAYKQAINILRRACSLPVLLNNEHIKENFVAQINFLQQLQKLLANYHMESMSFDEIPEEYLKQAQENLYYN